MNDVAALLQRLHALEGQVTRLESQNGTLRTDNSLLSSDNKRLTADLQRLQRKVDDLLARLGLTSANSSKPPSTDPDKSVSKKGRILDPDAPKKPIGAQDGHTGHARRWFPSDEVTRFENVRPASCDHCHADLSQQPPAQPPAKRQVVEIPVLRPDVIEYHLHTLACPHCAKLTTALPPSEATTGTGPRATALMATLCGRYRLSREETAHLMETVLGIPMSKGSVQNACEEVSEALRTPVGELVEALPKQATVHLDETGWRQGKERRWLWVAVTGLFTVFAVHAKRGEPQLRAWYPKGYSGVVHSDRWGTYGKVFKGVRRQVCWAHLLRDMQGIIDRGAEGKAATVAAKEGMGRIFKIWHGYKNGKKSRGEVVEETAEDRKKWMEWGKAGREQREDTKWKAMGKWLVGGEGSVFRFIEEEGVEPTNNAAEQAVRAGVMWRRGSQGTRSAEGSVFVERLLSVGATCRQQGREVWTYLYDTLCAWRRGTPPPSLLPVTGGGR